MPSLIFDISEAAQAAFVEACDTPYEYVAQHLQRVTGTYNYIETLHKIKGGKEMIIATDSRMEGLSVILLAEEMT
jgi:hypothetical protein